MLESPERISIPKETLALFARRIARLDSKEYTTLTLPDTLRRAYSRANKLSTKELIQDLRAYTYEYHLLEKTHLEFDPTNPQELFIATIDNEVIQFTRLT